MLQFKLDDLTITIEKNVKEKTETNHIDKSLRYLDLSDGLPLKLKLSKKLKRLKKRYIDITTELEHELFKDIDRLLFHLDIKRVRIVEYGNEARRFNVTSEDKELHKIIKGYIKTLKNLKKTVSPIVDNLQNKLQHKSALNQLCDEEKSQLFQLEVLQSKFDCITTLSLTSDGKTLRSSTITAFKRIEEIIHSFNYKSNLKLPIYA